MKNLSSAPLAEKILNGIKTALSSTPSRPPSLTFILVGSHGPSLTYVSRKVKACKEVGMVSNVIHLDESIAYTTFKKLVIELNCDPLIDGVIIQMPLPKELLSIPQLLDPKKDVDGFTAENMGKLLLGDFSGMIPCTPHGIYQLLRYYQISLEKKHVVIMGRSAIVGKPLANLLSLKIPGANATVTVVHADTPNIKQLTKQADVLIVAIGQAEKIDSSYIKEGTLIIDVGIHHKEGKIVGDVNAQSVKQKASALSPVPGGVGPLTIACLLLNTYLSYKQKFTTHDTSKLIFEGHLLLGFE